MGRVKRRNRWLVSALLLVAAGLISPLIIETTAFRARAQMAGTAKEIQVQRIVVEDAKGNDRIRLDLFMNDPILEFLDDNGKTRSLWAW